MKIIPSLLFRFKPNTIFITLTLVISILLATLQITNHPKKFQENINGVGNKGMLLLIVLYAKNNAPMLHNHHQTLGHHSNPMPIMLFSHPIIPSRGFLIVVALIMSQMIFLTSPSMLLIMAQMNSQSVMVWVSKLLRFVLY